MLYDCTCCLYASSYPNSAFWRLSCIKSPAEVGGLKKYDFVCKIDGQPVANADDAHLVIDQAPIGEDLSLTLLCGESEVTVQVRPEDLSVRLKQLREERLKKKKTKA